MREDRIFFNKIVIGTRIVQYLVLMLGTSLLSVYFFNVLPEFPPELAGFKWGALILGGCFTAAGLLLLIGGPVTPDDCVYKQYRYLKKEELDVYYDMGHKIMIAFENQGGVYTQKLKKLRAMTEFRVAYYYNKKDGEPVMRQLELL